MSDKITQHVGHGLGSICHRNPSGLRSEFPRTKSRRCISSSRAATTRRFPTRFARDYIRKLMIELPKGNVVDLQQLVKSGDSVSVEDAVRNAVREYVRRRLHKAMEGAER